jgi:hypothetical protein
VRGGEKPGRDSFHSEPDFVCYRAQQLIGFHFGLSVRKQCIVALNLQAETGAVRQVGRIIQIVGGHMFAKGSTLVAES